MSRDAPITEATERPNTSAVLRISTIAAFGDFLFG